MAADASPSFSEGQPPVIEPRPGQVTSRDQITQGRQYLFRSSNKGLPQGFLSQPITVLEGPQLSKTNRTFVKCSVDYTQERLEELSGSATHPPRPQRTMTVFLSDVGIMEKGEFKPGTSIWLEDPEKFPKDS